MESIGRKNGSVPARFFISSWIRTSLFAIEISRPWIAMPSVFRGESPEAGTLIASSWHVLRIIVACGQIKFLFLSLRGCQAEPRSEKDSRRGGAGRALLQ